MSNPERTEALTAIIQPLPSPKYEVDYQFSGVERMLEWLADGTGVHVELNPDYQRGHVWTPSQKVHFITNILRGIVTQAGLTIQFNAPAWENKATGDLPDQVQCIDGLQRLTAVREFLAGEYKVMGLSADDLEGTKYDFKRTLYRFRVHVHTFQTRKTLLAYYLDINGGGTPHSQSELDRVAKLLEQA